MQKLKETHRKPPAKMIKATHKAGKQPCEKGRTFNTPARPKK